MPSLDRFGRITDFRYLTTTTSTFPERLKFGYDRNSNRLYKDNQLNDNFDELYQPNGAAANEAYDALNRLKAYARGQLTDTNSDGRPDTITTGASPKWRLNRCGSIVAEVMISFRSGRRGSSRLR